MNVNVLSIPRELRRRPQWVLWGLEQRGETTTKVPYIPGTLAGARSNDPSTWTTLGQALTCLEQNRDRYAGVGYVFSAGDGLVGIDLDKCASAGGHLEPWACEIVQSLGSYTEWSPSGRGLHIIARGELPPHGRRKGRIEMYDQLRFFTMTGQQLEGTPAKIEDRQEMLEHIHQRIFRERKQRHRPPATTGPVIQDDRTLIERAKAARNGDKFSALWGGSWQPYGYPSQSEADLALCRILAYWTHHDADRVDRLFRHSRLMRSKWDRRHFADGRTYGQATVQTAVGM